MVSLVEACRYFQVALSHVVASAVAMASQVIVCLLLCVASYYFQVALSNVVVSEVVLLSQVIVCLLL